LVLAFVSKLPYHLKLIPWPRLRRWLRAPV
jgi:hypothetical protein